MTEHDSNHDALGRWAEASGAKSAQLVRITALVAANRYTARPVAFDAGGATQFVGSETLQVINLAEPSDADGQVSADTDAVAVDVAGRWVVFIRHSGTVLFPAKVISSQGGAAYTVREQAVTGAGTFADAPGAADVTAHNLAELSLGPGSAVDNGTLVLVLTTLDNGDPPTVRYLFDHPAYAKYLD